MSISAAVRDMELSARPAHSRQGAFRARQHVLDRLVSDVEELVVKGARTTPAAVFEPARRAIMAVHGRIPNWLTTNVAPTALLNHLLVAEGKLRQQHYRGVRLELRESA